VFCVRVCRSGFNFSQGGRNEAANWEICRWSCGSAHSAGSLSFNLELANVLLVKKWLFMMLHDCMVVARRDLMPQCLFASDIVRFL
jgi:hypothetical protein